MASKIVDLRFAVRRTDGYMSSVWKLWGTKKGDIYLSTRSMTKIEKYSFHVSGICRSAFTKEHGVPSTMEDRAMFKWKRAVTPPRGSGKVSRVAWIAFPTDFLSAPRQNELCKKMYWITAAPQGGSTYIEAAYCAQDESTIKKMYSVRGERNLIKYTSLPNQEGFILSYYHADWENNDLGVPGEGEVNDLLFSSGDPNNTGRPIRIRFGSKPSDGDAIMLRELGGYALPIDNEHKD
ncbi:hypothetical protein MNBD_BACTEROID05-358 [hydrothermal vent metagenome]|uniref:Uncharacterized protein n=1 Tax=hydrothermal vent metagenome TaxID=652676 RepID=A0A3B0TRN1_9ZZZZ